MYTCNPSIEEAETDRFLELTGQLLHKVQAVTVRISKTRWMALRNDTQVYLLATTGTYTPMYKLNKNIPVLYNHEHLV